MTDTHDCPCSSGKPYTECCEPYLSGLQAAPDPEALMRSRYTAYATLNMAYLENTLHPKQRHDYDAAGAEQWARESSWEGLEIVSVAPGETANTGTVEFRASYSRKGEHLVHHEIAEFRRGDGRWYFFDGKLVGPGQFRRERPKTGRNEPCPCGSGRKYKKCCGK